MMESLESGGERLKKLQSGVHQYWENTPDAFFFMFNKVKASILIHLKSMK
jgi:hypothetical protein